MRPFRVSTFMSAEPPTSLTIRIPAGQVAADLTDFVLFVKLADFPNYFWDRVAAGGAGIRCSIAGVDVPQDLAWFNSSTKKGGLFIRVASVLAASDNDIKVRWATGLGALASTDPLGRRACWSGWGCAFYPPAGMDNRLDNANFGGVSTVGGNAQLIGEQCDFDGNNDYVRIPMLSAPTSWTGIAIGTIDTAAGSNAAIMSFSPNPWTTADSNRVTVAHRGASDAFGVWNTTNSWITSATTNPNGTNFALAYTHINAGARELFNNGVSVASGSGSAALPGSGGASGQEMDLGEEDASLTEDFDGKIDFAGRINSVASAAYIAAIYNNWRNRLTFYNVIG